MLAEGIGRTAVNRLQEAEKELAKMKAAIVKLQTQLGVLPPQPDPNVH